MSLEFKAQPDVISLGKMAGYYLLIFFLRGLASYCLVIKVKTISHEDSDCWEIFAASYLSLSAATTELRSFSGLLSHLLRKRGTSKQKSYVLVSYNFNLMI